MVATLTKPKTKQQIKGHTLKSPRQNENYYIYVWDKRTYNSNEVKEKRKEKGTRNYSKVKGWRSVGNMNNPSSWEELYKHLADIYGTVDEEEVRRYLEEKREEMEQKRIEKLTKLNRLIADEYRRMGIEDTDWIPDIKKASKILKELRA